MENAQATKVKRILLKLSGEGLKGSQEYGFDPDYLKALVQKVKMIMDRGIEVAIVVWGGNIYRGAWGKGLTEKAGHYIGMTATMINWLALHDCFHQVGIDAKLLSALSYPKVVEDFTKDNGEEYLAAKKVVICVGGVGLPYFSTDTGAVQRALELECDMLVKATQVDGVYDKDPKTNPDAKRIEALTLEEALALEIKVLDRTAIALAAQRHLPIFVGLMADVDKFGAEMKGTLMSPSTK